MVYSLKIVHESVVYKMRNSKLIQIFCYFNTVVLFVCVVLSGIFPHRRTWLIKIEEPKHYEKNVYSRSNQYNNIRNFNIFQSGHNRNQQIDLKEKEAKELGRLVQRRITHIQNPPDCFSAKKLLCDLTYSVGYGSQLHHLVACLISAYATNRTLILDSRDWCYSKDGWETLFKPLSETCTTTNGHSAIDWRTLDDEQFRKQKVVKVPLFIDLFRQERKYPFMPPAIPNDLADKILSFHSYPSIWWVGQFMAYLTRPNKEMQTFLNSKEDDIGFRNPIVGIHVRRTDKINDEGLFHPLEEYMFHVKRWYDNYEKDNPGVFRLVYLASDDPSVLYEAEEKYPNHRFVSDIVSQSKLTSKRYSPDSLRSIVHDAHFLSRCDYVVCTHTSNVCRLVYESMQTMHVDASTSVLSLDLIYHYDKALKVKTIADHVAGKGELNMQVDDNITIYQSMRDPPPIGFVVGLNERTQLSGYFPLNKTVNVVSRVSMPTYPEVTIDNTKTIY